MQKRFAQIIENMRGLIKDETWSASSEYLLAVSGGMDSMCMAELFLRHFGPKAFAVAHCNFHLRGEESDGDEALVINWALSNGVRFHSIDFDTERYASDKNLSIEMAARELRYAWFADLCRENGYRAVAVAHNANDNAETLVLNLLRGTGVSGLTGMSPIGELPLPSGSGAKLLRPLLQFTRKQIEGFVLAGRIAYRNDSTNALPDYKRNRVRNEAFPVFEKINPSFLRTLNRDMGYFSQVGDIVNEWCRREEEDVLGEASGPVVCRISVPKLLARRNWRYLLFHILERYGFNSSALESLENLLDSDRTVSGKMFGSSTHILYVERDELRVVDAAFPAAPEECCMPVRGAGTYDFNGSRWTVEVLDWDGSMPLKQPAGTIIFDSAKLEFPFVCRTWRQGDWFIPFGMKGRKKLSDLFTDLKFGALEKEKAVVVVDCRNGFAEQQRVAGIIGLRTDDFYKVTKDTKSIIRIKITPEL